MSNSVSSSLSSTRTEESGEKTGAAAATADFVVVVVVVVPVPFTAALLLYLLLAAEVLLPATTSLRLSDLPDCDDALEYELMSSSSILQLLHRIPIPESENLDVESRVRMPVGEPSPKCGSEKMSSFGRRLGRMLHLLQRMSVLLDSRKPPALLGLESTPDEYSVSETWPFGDPFPSSETGLGPTSDCSVRAEMRGNGIVSMVGTGSCKVFFDGLPSLESSLLLLARWLCVQNTSLAIARVSLTAMAGPRLCNLSMLLALDVDAEE